jgi:hypothetical protein
VNDSGKQVIAYADEIRRECFNNLLHCQWSEYEESFGEMFDAVMLQKAEAAIMGKPLDPEAQDCVQKNFWELAGKEAK